MGVDIDDTYAITMEFKGFQGTMLVDVVSRFATRCFILNLEGAQIRWNWEDKVVKLYDASKKQWQICEYPKGPAAKGYNPNIIEDMYVEEMSEFFKLFEQESRFPIPLRKMLRFWAFLKYLKNPVTGRS